MSTKFRSITAAVLTASAALLASSSASAQSRIYETSYDGLRLIASCKDDLGDQLLDDAWYMPLQDDALPADAFDDVRALMIARIMQAGRPQEEQDDLFQVADELFTALDRGLGAAMIAYPDRVSVTDLDKCAPMMPVLVVARDEDFDLEIPVETLKDCKTGDLSAWFELDVEDLHGAPLWYLDDARITPELAINEEVRLGALDVGLSASGHGAAVALTCSIWSSANISLQ